MKQEKFQEALTNIDDKYIDEALHYKKKKKPANVWKIVALAACFCLVLTTAFSIANWPSNSESSFDRSEQYDYPSEDEYDGYDYYEPEDGYGVIDDKKEIANSGESSYSEVTDGGYTSDSTSKDENIPANQDKIIYTVDMNMETKEFDKTAADIKALVKKCGGYFQEENVYTSNSNYKYADYIIRIPSEKLDEFTETLGEYGNITSLSKSSDNVTDRYYDVEARLNTAKAKLARLQELMKQASDMEDIITLEEAIAEVEYEIDSLTGSLKYMDSSVEYSTVYLDLTEVYKVNEDVAPMSFGEKLIQSFKNGFAAVGSFFGGLLLGLAENWIFLVVIAAVIIAAVILIRKAIKKSKAKKNEKSEEKPAEEYKEDEIE